LITSEISEDKTKTKFFIGTKLRAYLVVFLRLGFFYLAKKVEGKTSINGNNI
jgi:hypothetical protein